MYALGATAEQMQSTYDRISVDMERLKPVNETIFKALEDKTTFKDHLDQPALYSNYLLYFQNEIEAKGVKAALEEHLFANDEHAGRMLARWFASKCPSSCPYGAILLMADVHERYHAPCASPWVRT
jgi:hypothetical protein